MAMQNAGFHVRACCVEIPGVLKITKDAFGNITSTVGIATEILNWMDQAFNFTHGCSQTTNTMENSTTSLGALHYLANDGCDAAVGPTVYRYSRFQMADFIHPWVTEPVQLMIPMPVFISDMSAFLEPFTFTTWMVTLSAILVMITMLMLLDYFKGPPGSEESNLVLHWLFVIGILLGQGGFWASNKNRIRILMTVWILGSFIIVQLYTSQLFDYVMTSVPVPIVKSVEELADKSGIDLVVVKGFAPELMIKESETLVMKKLAKKLDGGNQNGSYRCQNVQECVKSVRNNRRPTVFIHQIGPMTSVMMNDYLSTGHCSFTLIQKSVDAYKSSWMVKKGDPLTEFYNRGMMRMHEAGLINRWINVYQPKPHKCLEMAKPQNDPRNPAKISLDNLAIAFGLLLFGLIFSSIVLVCEKCLLILMLKNACITGSRTSKTIYSFGRVVALMASKDLDESLGKPKADKK